MASIPLISAGKQMSKLTTTIKIKNTTNKIKTYN